MQSAAPPPADEAPAFARPTASTMVKDALKDEDELKADLLATSSKVRPFACLTALLPYSRTHYLFFRLFVLCSQAQSILEQQKVASRLEREQDPARYQYARAAVISKASRVPIHQLTNTQSAGPQVLDWIGLDYLVLFDV